MAAMAPGSGSARKAKPQMPGWGLVGSMGDDEMLNPGMLLADLVNEKDMPTEAGDDAAVRGHQAKAKKKKTKKVSAKKSARQQEEVTEHMEAEEQAFSEDESAAPRGDLAAAINKLGDGDDGYDARRSAAETRLRALQSKPESEFLAGVGGEEVSFEDLAAPLSEGTSFGTLRKQLAGLANADKMPDPVAEPKRNRETRSAQYDSTKKDQTKWTRQIQRNLTTEQVLLGEEEPEPMPQVSTLLTTFKPKDDFEKELEELTEAAGAGEESMKAYASLPMNSRIRDEKQVKHIAQLRSLMLREAQAGKRLNKIKSKTYRRIHRKAEVREREVLMERLDVENPELAKSLREEFEKKRVKLRLERQRSARKKWAQQMQRFAKGDKDAAREIAKQAQNAHNEKVSLRRAIAGKEGNADSDSDAVDLSDSDAELDGKKGSRAKRTIEKAKQLTVAELKDLEEGGDLPTTGVLGMKFMRDAIKQKREAAKQEASSVLKELEGVGRGLESDASEAEDDSEDDPEKKPVDNEAGGAGASGKQANQARRRVFTPEELAAAETQVEKLLENDGDGLQCSVAGPLSAVGMAAASVADGAATAASAGKGAKKSSKGRAKAQDQPAVVVASQETPPTATSSTAGDGLTAFDAPVGKPGTEDNPWEDNPWATADAESVPGSAKTPAVGSDANTGEGKNKRKKRKHACDGEEQEQPIEEKTVEDVLSALNADGDEMLEQRDLVRTTFIEGTQEADYDHEIDEKQRSKEEKEEAASMELSGWGRWAGVGIQPRKRKDAKGDKKEPPAKRSRVEVSDESKRVAKFHADKMPFGIDSPKQHEVDLKMPSGPEWNDLPSFIRRVKPKIFSKVGAIVTPLQYVKHLPKDKIESALSTWAAPKQPKRLKARI